MTTIIARYLTKTGKVGVEVSRTMAGSYSYTGQWGAGCRRHYADIEAEIQSMLRRHKGWTCDTSVIA